VGRKDARGEATGNDRYICIEAPLSGEMARIIGE
jgi:hypothetical protein